MTFGAAGYLAITLQEFITFTLQCYTHLYCICVHVPEYILYMGYGILLRAVKKAVFRIRMDPGVFADPDFKNLDLSVLALIYSKSTTEKL